MYLKVKNQCFENQTNQFITPIKHCLIPQNKTGEHKTIKHYVQMINKLLLGLLQKKKKTTFRDRVGGLTGTTNLYR